MATTGTKTAREGPVERIIFHKPHKVDRLRVFVDPPIYHIGNGDWPRTIRFENHTGGPVKIWLPNADKYFNRRPDGSDFTAPIEVARGDELELTPQKLHRASLMITRPRLGRGGIRVSRQWT